MIGRISKDGKFIRNEDGVIVGYIKNDNITDDVGNYIGYINKYGLFFDRGGNWRGHYNQGDSKIGIAYIIVAGIVVVLVFLLFKEFHNFIHYFR